MDCVPGGVVSLVLTDIVEALPRYENMGLLTQRSRGSERLGSGRTSTSTSVSRLEGGFRFDDQAAAAAGPRGGRVAPVDTVPSEPRLAIVQVRLDVETGTGEGPGPSAAVVGEGAGDRGEEVALDLAVGDLCPKSLHFEGHDPSPGGCGNGSPSLEGPPRTTRPLHDLVGSASPQVRRAGWAAGGGGGGGGCVGPGGGLAPGSVELELEPARIPGSFPSPSAPR